MNTFDYVIVGAGSAGCVLANKLGADTGKSILVIEAGPMDRNIMIHIPAGVYSAWRNPALNWNYVTEQEPHLQLRNIDMPRGKVVGGSSSINSMVYMRGHPLDYDRWASECGLQHWRYADCLPYFKAGETSDRPADDWRGDSGELGVSQGQFQNPLFDAFLRSGEQAGQGYSDDLNGFNPEGVARLDATRKNGRRSSASVAYLRPALKRGNVTLLCHALVHRIVVEQGRAVGVELQHSGARRTVMASQEVILSGGAINSPQLLMLSGIGPADHLREHGIDTLVPSESVGQNLQDHACIILEYESKHAYPIHKVDQPLRKAATGLQWVFTRKGIGSSNIYEAGGLIRGNTDVAYPNLQYHICPVGLEYQQNKILLKQSFGIHVDQLRPASRGHIKLRSSNPLDKPLLHFNYFAELSDLEQLVDGVMKTRELVLQSGFDGLRGAEIHPGIDVKTDDQIRQWIRHSVATDFHPCGTCRMGTDESAVVDDEFRVTGVDNLRVVDASVIPQIVSGNLNAPTQMIAARAADYIIGNPQRPAQQVSFAFQ